MAAGNWISTLVLVVWVSSGGAALGYDHIEKHHGVGFNIDLIHRDSPISPLHNPAKTKWQLLRDALRRSTSRARHFEHLAAGVHSWVLPSGGEYLMNISMGSPPVSMLGIVDTGSDLNWMQCQPCIHCYPQSLPIFDPNNSSSFNPVSCGSPRCYTQLASSTCGPANVCAYSYSYGDDSYSNGVLATETLSLGDHSFPQVTVGCGHDNGGSFDDKGSGLIGLGGGPLSLVSQIKPSIGSRFSYCLVPFVDNPSPSKISFGSDALVSGQSKVSTPLVRKHPSTFYYLTLESIRVGNHTVGYKNSRCMQSNTKNSGDDRYYYAQEGNIIIDSGTTLTLLPQEFYAELEASLKKEIRGKPMKDPQGDLPLCYKKSKRMRELPEIKVRFAGAAELELKPSNSFIMVEGDLICFAMVPATQVAIYGNLAQMDFLVAYDLDEGTVSFKPTHCSSHSPL